MKEYREFRPTQFDPRGLCLDNRQHWLVAPVMQTRDSLAIDLSNFRSTLRELGGESNTVEVHRFGHWGPGWFEIILIDPADEEKVRIATEIENALADYPVVDESDWSELEYELKSEYWASLRVQDRLEILQRYNEHEHRVNIFQARHDYLPSDLPYDDFLGEF